MTQDAPGATHPTADRTRTYLAALERKDLPALAAMTDPAVSLTMPLSFTGAPEPEARFTGKDEVLGYFTGVTENMARIRFADVRVSVTTDGGTSFVQAHGDFTVADGRPYRNVYVLRLDWDGERVARVEEYANPITFCTTFGQPMG